MNSDLIKAMARYVTACNAYMKLCGTGCTEEELTEMALTDIGFILEGDTDAYNGILEYWRMQNQDARKAYADIIALRV